MIAVSDTSPLNYLVLIGHVNVFPKLFGRIVTPPAVIAELMHPGAPPSVLAWAAAPLWLEIVRPSAIESTLGLGAGETEAISVARELNTDMLLIDERKAKAVAHRLGLRVSGTLNVLALAAERQLLDLTSAIAVLRKTTFREPTKLVEGLLEREVLRRTRS